MPRNCQKRHLRGQVLESVVFKSKSRPQLICHVLRYVSKYIFSEPSLLKYFERPLFNIINMFKLLINSRSLLSYQTFGKVTALIVWFRIKSDYWICTKLKKSESSVNIGYKKSYTEVHVICISPQRFYINWVF